MGRHDVMLVAAGFVLALVSSFGQTFFIALFGGEIRAEFGLSHGSFGAFYSAATLASGVLMLWVGAALDRTSLGAYAALATAALAAACILMASSGGGLLLLLGLFGLRLAGQGMMSHAAVTGMARAFSRNRGRAIAVATLGHPAGEAVLPVVAVLAMGVLGWRGVWLVAAALALLALPLLMGLTGRQRDAAASPPGAVSGPTVPSRSRAEMLRERRFYLMVPALVGPSFIVTGLFFHQVHLAQVKGWALSWLATSFAAYAVASTAAVILAGTLIDRFGAVRLMPFYLLPLALGCAILAVGHHDLVAVAFMGLAGATSGAAVAVVTAMWAEVYGTGHLGAIRALAASIGVVASALAPASMGWLIDAGVGMEAIAATAAVYLLAATLAVGSAFLRPAAAGRA